MLKLYDYAGAPNPRRVKIFAAEKQVELTLIPTDMGKGEHKTAEFLAKNPSGKIPVLELPDGRCIGESIAICRYLEALHPEPNLFGVDPMEVGHIEMRNRHIEFELWTQIGTSWVNGPVVASLFKDRPGFTQIAAAKEQSDKGVNAYYQRLDRELSIDPYIAGERFTVADISTLCAVDFATRLVALRPDDTNEHLWAWHRRVSARDSATA